MATKRKDYKPCQNFNECGINARQTLAYPTDKRSLYADRIYDNQTVNNRCYSKHPINIIEGFGKFNVNKIIRWVFIFIILCIIFTFVVDFFKPKEVVHLAVDSIRASEGGMTLENIFGQL
uniref:Uncharacterized protein n=1 Tax=Mimivirus LCMiAC02 TaxID=2506609 RepID=A0A481Z2W4_9VIRU|nr:MAG: hypothetical protein LCMiAC02_02170 [Mimivirus LCMiAC02]